MTLLPVIERELRAESRSAFTYWLRFFGAAALLTAGVLFFMDSGLAHMDGGRLFGRMHLLLFIAVWVVATLMTADAISRERREGTLGLLFLTPLRPFDVVLAKGLAHGLRSAAVGLAAVPVLVVPFLMGGVGWLETVASVLINFTALCWALTAGLVASSLCRKLTRALVLAAILDFGALVALIFLNGTSLVTAIRAAAGGRTPARLEEVLQAGWYVMMMPGQIIEWAFVWRGTPASAVVTWLCALGALAALSVALCLLAAMWAAQNIRRVAQQKERSVVLEKVEKQFCTPAFALGFYKRWMRRILERNPIGWLERRTWQARLVTWCWLAVMVSIVTWLAALGFGNAREFGEPLTALGFILAANVALTAAGSLRRERESGVIELMLVSPLSVRQIIRGRLFGIAGQFLPAAVLIFGCWLWLLHSFSSHSSYERQAPEQWVYIAWIAVTLVTLPAVGLYFSLRCRMFIVAVFWTAAAGFALPALAGMLFGDLIVSDSSDPKFTTGVVLSAVL